MAIEIRAVAADEIEAFQLSLGVPFGFDPTPEMRESFVNTFEHDRLRAAFDGDEIVGTFGAFSLEMTVPGGTLPTAGTTIVTVTSTHRRRGILRSFMTDHFRELRETGEPLAALWASESSIYGRFGYGPATEKVDIAIEKPFAKLQEPVDIAGTMRLLDKEEALRVLPDLYESVRRQRPGMYVRTENWWQNRALLDPESRRHGATAHRRVLHTRNGEPVGYVLYRTRVNREESKASTFVVELIAVDAEAERALWQYLFGIDLVTKIEYWNSPVANPLSWWMQQSRKMERTVEDALWVRPVDVVAALNGRRYAVGGSFVFRMRDELCPWNDGVYRLAADESGTGRCEPCAADVEVELTPFALGSIFLGGYRVLDLANAGVIRGSDKALRNADSMFAWHPLPWCQEVF